MTRIPGPFLGQSDPGSGYKFDLNQDSAPFRPIQDQLTQIPDHTDPEMCQVPWNPAPGQSCPGSFLSVKNKS